MVVFFQDELVGMLSHQMRTPGSAHFKTAWMRSTEIFLFTDEELRVLNRPFDK